jgi:hypothetical protein
MVFNATFKNISVILWRSVLLVEEIGVLWVLNMASVDISHNCDLSSLFFFTGNLNWGLYGIVCHVFKVLCKICNFAK